MKIEKSTSLSKHQLDQLLQLWNDEYPKQITYHSLIELEIYLEKLMAVEHTLIVNENDKIKGWYFQFDREGEKWFVIIISSDLKGKGWGKKLMRLAQEKEDILNGWVTDHDRYLRRNGEVYSSPLGFYKKLGFRILNERMEKESPQLSAVKIRWTREPSQ